MQSAMPLGDTTTPFCEGEYLPRTMGSPTPALPALGDEGDAFIATAEKEGEGDLLLLLFINYQYHCMLSVVVVESTPSVISGREGGGETIGARTEGLEAFDKRNYS